VLLCSMDVIIVVQYVIKNDPEEEKMIQKRNCSSRLRCVSVHVTRTKSQPYLGVLHLGDGVT
jgi:hypothetical protein